MGFDLDKLHQELRDVETAPCPGCGRIGGHRQESHPATGTMVNCGCGARSGLTQWLAGIVEYRRNPDGTYRRAN